MRDLSPTLDLEAEGSWAAVYRCRVCGRRWAKEFPFSEMQGGGPPCVYAVSTDDPKAWLAGGADLPARLRQSEDDRAFYDSLGEERADARCSAEGCSRGAISLSTFCRRHHFEMIMRKPCAFR
jgi:hypothetical protein